MRELESAREFKALLSQYYTQMRSAKERGQLVVWVTGVFPVELIRAMDAYPVYPENHAALCASRKMAVEIAQVAEEEGYSTELCSYARVDFGSCFSGKSPVGGLPKPDLVVCCNNQCGTVTKWWESLARYFDVPCFLLDMPFLHEDDIPQHKVDYVVGQIHELFQLLERLSGRKLDPVRFKDVVSKSVEASRLWQDTMALAKHVPSPLTAFDTFVYMAPMVVMRGTQEAIDYYRKLKADVEGLVAKGIGAVPNERYRLLWDNLPMWFNLRELSEELARMGACLVASPYPLGFTTSSLDPEDPVESIARHYMSLLINRNLDWRTEFLERMAREFSAHGIILHSNYSCKPYGLGFYDIKDILAQKGIPCVVIDGDMTDSRKYSHAQTVTRLQAFIELL